MMIDIFLFHVNFLDDMIPNDKKNDKDYSKQKILSTQTIPFSKSKI